MSPIVILVRPQMGENIGMSARAMGNCGLDTLRIVSPRDGWPSASALAAARGAVGIVEGARVFGSVGEAVSDCTRVMATSARLRDRNVCVYSPEAAVLSMRDSMMGEQAGGGKGGDKGGGKGGANDRVRCCVLFGPENNGLDNEDMSYADGVIRADLEEGICSINLAMAVFMLCWEWRRMTMRGGDTAKEDDEEVLLGRQENRRGDVLAGRGDVVGFMRRLEGALEGRGFYRGDGSRAEVRLNLRAMGMRAGISEQELRTLEGVLSALLRERKEK